MGEYLTIDGTEIKLGTLDDWRYVRRDECEAWARRGLVQKGQATPAEGCRDASTLWRFPFPWEDNAPVSSIHDRNMTDAHRFTFKLPPSCKVEHRARVVPMGAPAGAYNVNVYVPCPYLLTRSGVPYDRDQPTDRAYLCSPVPAPTAYLVGERYDEHGNARTVFGCIYCERWFALPQDELDALRRLNPPGRYDGPQIAEVLRRLRSAQPIGTVTP